MLLVMKVNYPLLDVEQLNLNDLGLSLTKQNFTVMTANHLVQWELLKAGVGIGVIPEGLGDAEPSVQRALPYMPPLVFPIWLTTHRDVNTSRRVRLVFDLLADELAKAPKPTTQIAI